MQYNRRNITLVLVAAGIIFINPVTASTSINTLFMQTKPQCIGRYVIDVPESFNNQVHDMIFIDDFKIESKRLYPPAFKQRVQLREHELRDAINKSGNESKNAPFIKEKIVLPDEKGIIFDRNISGEDDLGRVLEAHVFVDMTAFIITTELLDLTDPKYSERKKIYIKAGFTEAQMNERPAKLASLQSLISRLSGRKDEDIPSAKGVCIPNGFIRDDGSQHLEKITFQYENNDFILGVYTNNKYPGSADTLFNRSAQINEALKTSNKYTIKKVALSPNGIPAESWLFGGTQTIRSESTGKDEENTFYDFDFKANERDATSYKPKISIGLTSEYKKTRYSEAQMIEIWDRLVNSLRYE
ncbi:T6SS immunity protein Tli4 family protein [uncultured Pluralibacter sp.]|uniref:T6SS immunity protein Tli4 family protein n=1 Tax=uncultured Pluralibacter sp. TaxID=1490864 RepID=UPI002614F177|nr:T6SS immunity protein Tli4 family protein [uncultured Pluralibacter sp.]